MSIAVTGLGIVSAIGMNVEENLHSLQNLESGISTIELLKGLEQNFLGGEIKLTNQQLAEIAFGEKQNELLPRSLLLSLIAAKQAWRRNTTSPKIKTAIILSSLFNFSALCLGAYLAIIIGKPLYSLIFVYCIFFLWRYSKSMKNAFLIGNLHVAILTALVLINTALFDIIPNIHFPGNESGVIILKITLVYALFSFLLTLIREFIKDLEDKEGDISINAKTLAIVLGSKKTKIISLFLTLIVVGIVVVWQYFQYQIISLNNIKWNGEIYESVLIWGTDKFAIIYTAILQTALLFFMLKLFNANSKSDFYYLSQLNKIIMLLGICSIPFFTYCYFQ